MSYTNQEINEALKKALAEKGEDYVYPLSEKHDRGCMYATDEGAPSCIVGHVLHTLDPELFAGVAKWERMKSTLDTAMGDVVRRFHPDLHPDQVKALSYAQVAQDRGQSWGYAATEYMRALGESEL